MRTQAVPSPTVATPCRTTSTWSAGKDGTGRGAVVEQRSPAVFQRQFAALVSTSPRIFAQAQSVAQLMGASAPATSSANPLPGPLKARIEALSGISMDHVRVHRNSPKPAQLQAHAYAQGSEIHLAPGQERHLPHEAWHAVQQAQGRVRPTLQMKSGVPINDDAGLEREADVMGAKAVASAAQIKGGPDLVNASYRPESVAQRCVLPTNLAKGKTPQERLDEFIKYAEWMSDKADKRGYAAMEKGFDRESEAWYEVPGLFEAFVEKVKGTQKLQAEEIPQLLSTLEDFLHEANVAYDKVKRTDFSKEAAPKELKEEKGAKKKEDNSLSGKVRALPGREFAAVHKIKGNQTLSKKKQKEIEEICQTMVNLKEAMTHGDGQALVHWMSLFNQLLAYVERLSEAAPEEYVALIQNGVIGVIKDVSKMFDGGEMCNEELPKEIMKCLAK